MSEQLKAAFARFNQQHTFSPGDIVRWKPEMKNRRSEGPFTVIEVISPPLISREQSAGSPYFMERLDLALGFFDSDGDFFVCHFDSKRFEPVS